MVWYDRRNNQGYPVIERDGEFYKRGGCDTLTKLTAQEMKEVAMADGRVRPAYFINNQMPGPTIVVYEDQQVEVRIRNKLLNEGVTVHWHGMVQRNTNWMDGVGSVTQCNIQPEELFVYKFLASPAGTHWYHSHTGTQRTDGLSGGLIVLPKIELRPAGSPPLQVTPEELFRMNEEADPRVAQVYDKDFLVLVGDWFGEDSAVTIQQVLSHTIKFVEGYTDLEKCYQGGQQHDGAEVAPVLFESVLVNGKGRVYLNRGNDSVSNEALMDTPRETFTVSQDKFYRFRVINPSMNFAFKISIDNHPLVVTASDGDLIRSVLADSLIAHNGERYDFYIHANQTPDNYWMRAYTTERYQALAPTTINDLEPGMGRAIVHYDGAADTEPTSQRTECTSARACTVVNCPFESHPEAENTVCVNYDQLRSARRRRLPELDPDTFEEHFLNFHFAEAEGGFDLTMVNGRQFVLPSTPPAVSGTDNYEIPCTAKCDQGQPCICTHQVDVGLGNLVQLVLVNRAEIINVGPSGYFIIGAPHPVHLHGQSFHVVKVGYPEVNSNTKWLTTNNADINCPTSRCHNPTWANSSWAGGNVPDINEENPPAKDTLIIPVGGYVVVRFVADNPGWWLMHCHVELHQVQGMVLIIKAGDNDDMVPAPTGFPTCGSYNPGAASASVVTDSAPDVMYQPQCLALSLLCVLLSSVLFY